MLDRLLGTLDPATGLRADDGLMERVSGAQYRMQDIDSYHFFLCTYQTVLTVKLWAAAGLQGLLLQVNGHDPAAVFIPDLGHWVYEDPGYNNEYLLDGVGDPLSPVELLSLSTNGIVSRAIPSRIPGPAYDPETYIHDETYVNAINRRGYRIVGSRMYTFNVPNPTPWGRIVMIDVPDLDTSSFSNQAVYPRVTPDVAFPGLGVVVTTVSVSDSVFVVSLGSTYPHHERFERRIDGGDWESVAAQDVLPVGACRVEYRSVDHAGTRSANSLLDVWAPRTDDFLEVSTASAVRQETRLCT